MIMRKTLLYMTAVLLCTCFLLSGADPALAAAQRVYDGAGLFTEQEAAQLEVQLQEAAESMDMDLAVLTTLDTDGYTTEQYADDFYEESGFGTGMDHSGALLMIDMGSRELYISTEGHMARILTDERIEAVLDTAMEDLGNQAYGAAVGRMIGAVSDYAAAGVVSGQYHYDRDTGKVSVYRKRSITWYEAALAVLAAGATGVLTCSSVVKQYKMERERKQSLNFQMAYRGSSAFAFTLANDLFINKMLSQRRIPRNTGSGGRGGGRSGRSTMHRSSSGRSHGGGGRRF